MLGAKSDRALVGVHPDLVAVVRRAIQVTPVDFSVIEGVRTAARQSELVQSGASLTRDSRHLTGHAVDLAAYVGGRLSWDWPLYYRIASAVRQAANEEQVPIRWGGVWDRHLEDLDGLDLAGEVAEYVSRRKAAGLRVFIDGPHFELAKERYP